MASKRKRRGTVQDEAQEPVLPKVPEIGTKMGALLERAGLQRVVVVASAPGKPAPARPSLPPRTLAPPGPAQASVVHEAPGADAGNTSLSSQELAVLHRAYVGVEPIRRPTRGRVRPSQPGQRAPAAGEDPADAEARARLAALVGAGVRFEVQRGDGFVQGLRQGTSEKLLRPLASSGYQPEATLDLHGLRRDEALRAVHDFVRAQQRTGARYLLIIAGKGQHSPGGVSVLREAVVEALTQGGAAPLVRAFASAHVRHGGSGALAVQLA